MYFKKTPQHKYTITSELASCTSTAVVVSGLSKLEPVIVALNELPAGGDVGALSYVTPA
jgi:hypothetical protein